MAARERIELRSGKRARSSDIYLCIDQPESPVYSAQAQRAIAAAREEQIRKRYDSATQIQMLIGLFSEYDGLAADILVTHGFGWTAESASDHLAKTRIESPRTQYIYQNGGWIPSPNLRNALLTGWDRAHRAEHLQVTTAHILFGLTCRPERSLRMALDALSIDFGELVDQTEYVLESGA